MQMIAIRLAFCWTRTRVEWVFGFVCALTAPAACLAQRGDAVPPIAWQPDTLRLGDVSLAVERGTVRVPSVRARPEAGQLTLRLLRLKSLTAQSEAPIVYLAGGPGDSGIEELQQFPASWLDSLRAVDDVIALDQRGTGGSEPRDLQCDRGPALPLDRAADPELYAQVLRERLRRCAELMRERGVSLGALTTAENADDLETLRRALGAEQIRLFGGSYGSHLALAAVRRHPGLVHSMVLSSIEGPDHTLKLPSQIDAGLASLGIMLQSDTFYARELPDLPGAVRTLIERLRRAPVQVTIDGHTVELGAWDLRKHVADAMGRGAAMRRLPATILASSREDFTALGRWALGYRRTAGLSMMGVTMDCASYASGERLARIRQEGSSALVGDLIDFPFPDFCNGAPLPRLPEEFRSPLHSEVPALFIVGSMDARTPEANARAIAATMPNARVLVIDNAPHGIPGHAELPGMIGRFLRGGGLGVTRLAAPIWQFTR